MKNEIMEIGLLSDETFIKRFPQTRRVFSPLGISPTIPAACGMGGGITPKIITDEERRDV